MTEKHSESTEKTSETPDDEFERGMLTFTFTLDETMTLLQAVAKHTAEITSMACFMAKIGVLSGAAGAEPSLREGSALVNKLEDAVLAIYKHRDSQKAGGKSGP